MALPLDSALELLDPIMKLQNDVDKANDREFAQKYKCKKQCKEKLRWDDRLNCLRYPCITKKREKLLNEMYEITKLLPRFWSTALFADHRILKYMNKEEQEIMLKYLKSVHVTYHGDAKTGFEITFSFYKNPHFKYFVQSKTFWFTREGISSARGSEIGWTTDKDTGGTQLHTDTASFFKWFAEDSQSSRDLLAEEIVLEFWPKAHKYYLIGKARNTELQSRVLTEHQSARKKSKRKRGGEKSEDGLSKLTTISAKLQKAEEEATELRCTREIEYELMLVEGERKVHKECESLRRHIYNQRNEIIKNIPHFWLIAFLSHYALHYLLSEEDQKIFRYLNSVNVEETEDNEGVISGYTITLNFDNNPYFENGCLKKTISYTVMSTDPLKEYSDGEVKICVSDIHWKDGKDITSGRKDKTTGNERGFTDTGTSFFTWFSDRRYDAMEAYDQVADLIKQDFWPDAGRYFAYGNLDDGKKVDLVAIDKAARFTSSQRAFFI
ncbi:hypothetical protein MKX03_003626 [Papaver bracteatum]|nr:hypothetical protein MKX03_003626 [Papaver bracteatum]